MLEINLLDMGKRIKMARTSKEINQKELAKRVGVNPSYISLVENGKRMLCLDALASIAELCDVSTDYLLFGKEDGGDCFRTVKRLLENYPEEEVARALKVAEYSLSVYEKK